MEEREGEEEGGGRREEKINIEPEFQLKVFRELSVFITLSL